MTVIWRVARQAWTLWGRDQRTRWAGILLLALLTTCIVSGVSAQAYLALEQDRAMLGDGRAWDAQGVSHPHDAAHFGRTVFRANGPLAFLDPGVSARVGVASRLEAHLRHPAHGRPADAATVLHRFPPVSVALVLQLVLPLVVMLTGFSLFAGEESRAVARLEIAAGVSAGQLLAGRALALAMPVLLVMTAVAAVGGVSLVREQAPIDEYAKLVMFLIAHGSLLTVVIGLTLLVSLRAASARQALIVLLGLWMVGLWLVPRLAATIAEAQYPVPTVAAIHAAISEQTKRAKDGSDQASARLAEELERLRLRYGVARDEDLPINVGGLSLEVGEAVTSAAYDRAFADVQVVYQQQASARRWWTLISPLVPVAALSATAAGTDLLAHERFLREAEGFRYDLVQSLNRHSRDFAGAKGSAYVTDVRGLKMAPFRQTPVPWVEVWGQHRLDEALALLWCVVTGALLVRAGRRHEGVL